MRSVPFLLALVALAAAPARAGPLAPPSQPAAERARQNPLPQSKDPLWTTLAKTEVSSDPAKGIYIAHHPDAVRALDGHEITVSGYMLQTDPLPPFTHFILSRRTPVCAFCPPGEPNEAIEVFVRRFIGMKPGLVSVHGLLHAQKDGSQSLIFVLSNSEVTGGDE
ncbi:hypothetical protein BH09PSE2_BH09PSE2_17990 [soil metagenome]